MPDIDVKRLSDYIAVANASERVLISNADSNSLKNLAIALKNLDPSRNLGKYG